MTTHPPCCNEKYCFGHRQSRHTLDQRGSGHILAVMCPNSQCVLICQVKSISQDASLRDKALRRLQEDDDLHEVSPELVWNEDRTELRVK